MSDRSLMGADLEILIARVIVPALLDRLLATAGRPHTAGDDGARERVESRPTL